MKEKVHSTPLMTVKLDVQRPKVPAFTVWNLFIQVLLSTNYVSANVWMGTSTPVIITLFGKQKQELKKQIWTKNPHMKMCTHILGVN